MQAEVATTMDFSCDRTLMTSVGRVDSETTTGADGRPGLEATVARSRMGIKDAHGREAAMRARGLPRRLPDNLHHAAETSLRELEPGDLVLLESTSTLRTRIDSSFFAVLACPSCGALGLITASQYLGASPVVCGSDVCPCRFKIDDQSRLIYLPVN